MVFKIQSIVVL